MSRLCFLRPDIEAERSRILRLARVLFRIYGTESERSMGNVFKRYPTSRVVVNALTKSKSQLFCVMRSELLNFRGAAP
jgi:hypothetical protein